MAGLVSPRRSLPGFKTANFLMGPHMEREREREREREGRREREVERGRGREREGEGQREGEGEREDSLVSLLIRTLII